MKTNNNVNSSNVEYVSDVDFLDDESGVSLYQSPEMQNRRKLNNLLEKRKLRRELDEYDEYLATSDHDDDIIDYYRDYEYDD